MHQFLKFLLFCSSTLRVSDGLFVHHQESKTVHTAPGICQTEIPEIGKITNKCTHSIRYMSYRFCGCWQAAIEPVWYDAVCTVLDS